ncbi:MAG: tetratricopeptide repeat protein, partial [Gemmatimonadetes bacterium]|nr:tetratricopeptide repeat protein [Gemmatimonadota bacterium]
YEEAGVPSAGMAETLLNLGRYEEAKQVAEARVAETPSAQVFGVLGSAAAALGDRETALAMEEVLMEMEAAPYVFGGPGRWRALIRAQLGDLDTAVQFLEEAYAAGASFGRWLHYHPQLDALRGYPAFERFIAPR